jgi:hypothetical protein
VSDKPEVAALTIRREALRGEFLTLVDLLDQRRAAEIDEGRIDEAVALRWLEWHGGTLRLTAAGEQECRRLRTLLRASASHP